VLDQRKELQRARASNAVEIMIQQAHFDPFFCGSIAGFDVVTDLFLRIFNE
jgi:hypothetical protein